MGSQAPEICTKDSCQNNVGGNQNKWIGVTQNERWGWVPK